MPLGWERTRGRPILRKDLRAMTDKAKRKRKFEANVAENQRRVRRGKKARTLTERDLDKFRSRSHRIRRLQAKAADMRVKAKEVERSKTGNVKAAATYRRTAAEYLKQAAALRPRKK